MSRLSWLFYFLSIFGSTTVFCALFAMGGQHGRDLGFLLIFFLLFVWFVSLHNKGVDE